MDIKTKRKEDIFDAALLCFNKRGYAETTISIIAQKAGISKGGMYHYFTSKRELFLELFLYKVKQYHSEELKKYLLTIEGPEERLQALLNETGRLLLKNEAFYRFCLEFLSMGARDKEIRKVMTGFYKSTVEIFQHMVNEGIDAGKFIPVDAKKIARVLYILVMGTFFTYFSINIDFDIADQVSFQTNFVMKAI
ncbi:MAG: TetR/AcrR family transcriptional regulator [Pseudomonadota bacterium]